LQGPRRLRADSPFTWLGAFVGIKADWKAQKQLHRFQRYYQTTFPCPRCLCTQPYPRAERRLSYLDMSASAPYAQTVLTDTDYVALDQRCSHWSSVPGFALSTCYHDLLHVLFLGVGKDVVASLLVDILPGVPGADTEERLANLTVDCQQWCRARGVPCPKHAFTACALGIPRHRPGRGFPELASYFKGSTVKLLLSYVAHKAASPLVARPGCLACIAFCNSLSAAGDADAPDNVSVAPRWLQSQSPGAQSPPAHMGVES
jgi:hypothetical protein